MPTSKYHRVYKFNNGATLIYFKHNVNNTTRVSSAFISGAQKDIIPGTAHFLEHMMANLGDKQDLARRNDIHVNAFTSSSYVAFDLNIPNKHLDQGFEILKTMTFNSNFDPNYFENERKAILQEKELYSHQPRYITDLYNESYSRQKLIGTEKDINKITIKDIEKYKKQNFVSENLVICVTSSLDFDTIKNKVEESIVSNLPSDISKKNTPYQDKKMVPKSYFIYQPVSDVKTIQLTFAIVTKMSFEGVNIYEYVDDFMFNDSFSGLLLDKFRTEKGIVYSAQMHNEYGVNNHVYKVFTITTTKDHVNEIIETLAEVLDIARKGMSINQYDDFISKLKTIETERRVQQKYLDSATILQRYIMGDRLWFNNPVHKAVKLTMEKINNYISKTYKNKPIYFNLVGDFDLEKIYSPVDVQEMTKSKRFDLVRAKDSTGVYYYSSKTGEDVKEKDVKNSDKHTASIQVIESANDLKSNKLINSLSSASMDGKMIILERLSRMSGVDNLELRLKEFNAKKTLIELFAKKLNIKLDLITGVVKEVKDNNDNDVSDEKFKALRQLSFEKRLQLISIFAKNYKLNLDFNISRSSSESKNENQDEIQK